MASLGSTIRRSVVDLDWTALAAGFALGALLLWFISSRLHFVVLLGGFLVDGRAITFAGIIGIVVLLLIGWVRKTVLSGRLRRPKQASPAGPARRGVTVSSEAQSVVIGLIVTFFALMRLGGWFFGSDSVVLSPAAPAGCRIAAQESSAMLIGDGELYQIDGNWGIGHRILAYTVDDGGRPFEAGDYRLTWTGPEGYLVLSTDQGALASPNTLSMRCG